MQRIKQRLRSMRLGIVLCAAVVLSAMAHSQTITVLHSFSGGADGSLPYAGVTLDRSGNLYGTTTQGGSGNVGTVYKLTHSASGWTLSTLYTFNHPNDPALTAGGVVFGPDGTLYGTGTYGGTNNDGAVYNLRPPASVCRSVSCPWTLTLLHSFSGSDGSDPFLGNLIFDAAGNIYGTTSGGGAFGQGTVFKLTHSGDSWTESVLYSFTGGDDGADPENGLAFDSVGNLYGTAAYGGEYNYGTLFELSPAGSGWTETTLHTFDDGTDGGNPVGSVVVDGHGNLYGTTEFGGGGAGTVWRLRLSNFTFTTLYSITGYQGPFDTPTLDAAGNVYGTSSFSGGCGDIFKLSPNGGGWNYTSYDFTNGCIPLASVTVDGSGDLYGTTSSGGSRDDGTVWELTP